MNLTDAIKNKAIELGFDLAGITTAAPIQTEQVRHFANWLNAGFASDMQYMQRNLEKRFAPARLLENAQSVIVVCLNYTPLPTEEKQESDACVGRVANYALYEDYHLFITKRLHKLADFITSLSGPGHKFRVCVDSAPLAERALALRAGLGFIGKNHMLINPILGPQILLGEIITDIKLKPDKPIATNCSDCNKCIEACPTGALRLDGRLDANKCISYLTTEYKGPIPPGPAEKIGDRLFGCDECVMACPYQGNAPPCSNKDFKFYPDRNKLDLDKVISMTEQEFKTTFAGSCIKRLGFERLKRNARICIKNLTRR
ncbi:MAG: tRNA epoxyqueuosine(34) reductase QueG [Planctomycetota bacterium]|jgi:epoxyqueuosine reductase